MQRGRGGSDDLFGFGGIPFGFGGFGGPGSLISSFFGGTDPFDDPFFTRPFESMMRPSFFGHGGSLFGATNRATHGGFLEHENILPPTRSRGPIIKELNSDDEGEETEEQQTDLEKANPRKHLRADKDPYVEDPDEAAEGRKNKIVHSINDFNRANAKRQQNGSYFFQSSTVSYGGPGGTYYTSSTKRAGGDGVVMEESKEADSSTGKASHRVSKGLHGKGHSVTRKLNTDGRVDTLQTLHNLNEDELHNFEGDWNGKARQYLPEWNSSFTNGNMRIHDGNIRGLESSGRLALPLIPQAQPNSSRANIVIGHPGQASSRMAAPASVHHSQPQFSGRMKSQTRPNPHDRRFH